MKETYQEEYYLLGWSLGGLITLEIDSSKRCIIFAIGVLYNNQI
jgi:hypothetical protein